LHTILTRLEAGEGTQRDVDLLLGVANNMQGNTICALADAAAMPTRALVTKFRAEFEEHVRVGGCPFHAPAGEFAAHAHG
jgi:NADH-quinone oxidoreductase subunit F